MDNYTKMFDCPEIQDGWVPKVGDRTDKGLILKITMPTWYYTTGGRYQREGLIWLPSIEQLMGMVDWPTDKFHALFKDDEGYNLEVEMDEDMTCIFTATGNSVQEVWLKWVMHELHSKKWSGKRWNSLKG